MVKKIVVIGPESTGKSTLCKHLAAHFHTIWCPEYAREYLLQNGIKYTYADLLKIAQGQLLMEDHCTELVEESSISKDQPAMVRSETGNLLFIDTNMNVMKVWYEYVFGKCEQLVLDEIAGRKYDLYLLCDIDLAWIDEPMREYPDKKKRKELFNIYKDILINQETPWTQISGDNDERFRKAINAVQLYCII